MTGKGFICDGLYDSGNIIFGFGDEFEFSLVLSLDSYEGIKGLFIEFLNG